MANSLSIFAICSVKGFIKGAVSVDTPVASIDSTKSQEVRFGVAAGQANQLIQRAGTAGSVGTITQLSTGSAERDGFGDTISMTGCPAFFVANESTTPSQQLLVLGTFFTTAMGSITNERIGPQGCIMMASSTPFTVSGGAGNLTVQRASVDLPYSFGVIGN